MSSALAFVCANFPDIDLSQQQKDDFAPCLKEARALLEEGRYSKALGTVVMRFGWAVAGNTLLDNTLLKRNHEHAVQELRELELNTHRSDIRAAIKNQDVYETYQASNRLLLALGLRTSDTTQDDVALMTTARTAFQGQRYAVSKVVIETLEVFLKWKTQKPATLTLAV